jgi:hypothetical protein
MDRLESEIYVGGPLDSDSEDRAIRQPYLRDALYLRMGTIEKASKGSRTAFLGNEPSSLVIDDLPAGTNTVIGMCTWIEAKGIIIFYHNSNDNDTIICYFPETDTFSIVMQGDLKFDLAYPIIDANVVGDLLSWTDGKDSNQFFTGTVVANPLDAERLFNPMMRINAAQAIAGNYPNISLQSIEALIWPPWYGPAVEYGSVADQPNQLRSQSFEFVYQWGYADGEWSVFSPLSDLAIPKSQEWVQGPDYSTPFADNVIYVTINTGIWRVKRIRIAVRTNHGNFVICREIDKGVEGLADDTTFVYPFFNNVTYRAITSEQLGYPALTDNMPQVIKRMNFFTPTNQMAVGAFWQDYDNVEMDYTVESVATEITTFKPDYANISTQGTVYAGTGVIRLAADTYLRFDFSEGDTYSFTVNVTSPVVRPVQISATLTAEEIATALAEATVLDQVKSILEAIGFQFAESLNVALGVSDITVFPDPLNADGFIVTDGGTSFQVEAFGAGLTYLVKPLRRTGVFRSLKKGWRYYVGFQYYDRGLRSGTVQKDPEEYILDVPFPSAEAARDAFTNPNNPYYVRMRLTINNLPPIWADSYKVVVKKVRRPMMQTTIHRIEVDPNLPQTYKISYDNYYTGAFGAKISYIPQVDDIVRFLTKNIDIDIEEVPEYVTQYQETQVVKWDASGGINGRPAIWISQFDLSILGEAAATGISSQLIEVFQQPLQEDNSLWHEIFDGEIINPHTNSRGHQGSDVSGLVSFDGEIGDVSFVTTTDLTNYLADPYIGSVTLTNNDNETETVETGAIVDLGGGDFKININGTFTFDFSSANGGSFVLTTSQQVSDGVSTTPAIINLDWGDVYLRQRIYETGYDGGSNQRAYYYIEDAARSDYYISDFYPLGRPAFENSENKRYFFKADGLHSGSYVDQTLRNNLSDYTGLNNRIKLNEANGEITRIVSSNKTLHFVQFSCTTPVYNGTYSVAGDGQVAQPAFTNNTFGAKGREVPFGSRHPRTVQMIQGVVFLYDFNRNTWAKLTDGGHASICHGKYKYSTEAFKISRELRDFPEDEVTVFSFDDELNSEYTTVFIVDGETKGYVFNYSEDGWSHRINYPVVWAQNLFSILVSTDGWLPYLHNQGGVLSFYETIYDPEFTFVFNDQPSLIKRLLAIGLKTNVAWDITNILISATTNYPDGMVSEIPAEDFEPKEEYLWAAYLNDKNSVTLFIPDLDTEEKALINGRNLLGSSATHTLKYTNDESIQAVIMSIHIVSTRQLPVK